MPECGEERYDLFIKPLEEAGFIGTGVITAAALNVYNSSSLNCHFDGRHWTDPSVGVVSICLLSPATMLLNAAQSCSAGP